MNIEIEDLTSEEVLYAIAPLQGFVNEREEFERRILRNTTNNIADFDKMRSKKRLERVLKAKKVLDHIHQAALVNHTTPHY